jgi:8-amino-7-oxononanoate synthase/dethiobiotin synthase
VTAHEAWAAAELERLERLGLRRYPHVLGTGPEPEVVLGDRRVILLCANNYLGLANHPRVVEAAGAAAGRWGAGAGASRLVSGTTRLHRELEQAIAQLKGTEDAVLFSSGYLANSGTIPALAGPGDVVLSDEHNHASIVDGCRLSGARKEVYRHADAGDLERRLAAAPEARRLVVTDTVFSMDGDLAPLRRIAEACERHGALLMVDEAHATGVLGPRGGGAVEACGLTGRVPLVMGTLSKALGSSGGFVAGPHDLVELLRNRARTHVFDTAPGAPAVGAALAALAVAAEEPGRRARARALARRLWEGLAGLGFAVEPPAAAVLRVLVGEPGPAMALAAGLLERGVLAPAIRPPTVPAGTARLRLSVMATHTDEHVERALGAFAALRPGGPAHRTTDRRRAPRGPGAVDPGILAAGGLFVTGTDTGVGKTVVSAALARTLGEAGLTVGALKPVQTGTDEGADDLAFVVAAGGVEPGLARAPYRFGAPLAPAVAAGLEGSAVDPAAIGAAFDELRRAADVVVVEGAGGLLVPVTDGISMGGLAAGLSLPVVVVARPGLGTLNHTALTVAAARGLGLTVLGIVLSGFPAVPGPAEATNPAVLERLAGVPLLGCLPVVDALDVDEARPGPSFDPAAWLAPSLGGTFDRRTFLEGLEMEVGRGSH